MSKSTQALLIILIILVFDQVLKVWVKTTMMLGEEHLILGDWFILHFTENNGMAFGMEFWGENGKVFLTLFRIAAVIGIGWYLNRLIRDNSPAGLVVSVSLIMAGAIGNIIDSVFYGVFFNGSFHQVAEFLPEKGGYSSILHGKVVDMLYFPVLKGHYPEWFPFHSGQQFIFFRPVFNIADSAITAGVISILVFQGRFFKVHHESHSKKESYEQPGQEQESFHGDNPDSKENPFSETGTSASGNDKSRHEQ
ncbi:MAG: lipoprotein signal peptidase [Bacteroidales bacterium]|nr:lipoprotein signal peptidase [Bacteroidales bacterium]